ncbi:MAG TPA: hypothetical protein VLM11_04425 [Streptosporangiaceae bacterium]|nr:hypothetical protein [Streptosporangiaceae bacterium]
MPKLTGLPTDDPIAVTRHEGNKYGIEPGVIGVADESSRLASKQHPDRFAPTGNGTDPNDVMGSVRALRREYQAAGCRRTRAGY